MRIAALLLMVSCGAEAAPIINTISIGHARPVTCTGSFTITGTSTGASSLAWTSSPSGDSGACTGTSSFSCVVSVSPDVAGEGVERITITATGGGTFSMTTAVGFYATGAHSCFLSQDINGNRDAGMADGDLVATWKNTGSSALDVVQGGADTLKPRHRTDAINGQPVVRCDGGDRLAASSATQWAFLTNSSLASTTEVVFSPTEANPDKGQAIVATKATCGSTSTADRGVCIYHDDRVAFSREDRVFGNFSTGYTTVSSIAPGLDDAAPAQLFSSAILMHEANASPEVSLYTNTLLYGSTATVGNGVVLDPVGPLSLCGETDAGLPATMDLFRVIIYPTALTATQRGINNAVDEWALNGTLPAFTPTSPNGAPVADRWVFVGDSITAGSSGVTNWPTKLAVRAPGRTFVNVAVSGAQTIAIRAQYMANAYTTVPEKLFVLAGVNDVINDGTAAAAYENIRRVYSDAQGQKTQVVALITMPFGNNVNWTSGRQTQLASLVALLKADPHIDVVIDFNTLMAQSGAPNALAATFDVGDGLHPSEAGTQFIADTVATALGLP